MGGVISAVFIAIKLRHPKVGIDKPLVDFDCILVLLPSMMFGSKLGAMLNQIFPDLFLSTILFILVDFLCYWSYVKGKEIYETENLDDELEDSMSNSIEPSSIDCFNLGIK